MSTLKDIKSLFFKNITENQIKKIIFSNPIDKSIKFQKVILLIEINQNTNFHFSMFFEAQVKHQNFDTIETAYEKIVELLETGYKQIDVISNTKDFKVLVNKSFHCKVVYDKNIKVQNENESVKINSNSNHDKEKNYILKQGEKIDWLVKLGIMTKEYKIVSSMQKKFRQINRFLELIDDINKYVPENAFIVDFGCGKSYLTFAIYYYFNIIKNKNVTIVGLDLKEEVVNNCQKLADEFQYTNLLFMTKDIKGV